MIRFELTETQEAKLDDWKEAIKKVYGSYGTYEYRFSHASGIGLEVRVYSSLAKTELDLTEVENW